MEHIERLPLWEMYPAGFGWSRFFVYAIALVTVAIFAYGIYLRLQAYKKGKPESLPRFDRPVERFKGILSFWMGQGKVLHKRYAGLIHAGIFFGFVVLFLGTAITTIDEDVYRPLTGGKFLTGGVYIVFSFLLEVFGLIAIAGISVAAYRRYVQKPEGLDNRKEDSTALILIAAILVTGFMIEGFRIAVVSKTLGHMPTFELAGFAGFLIASLTPKGAADALYVTSWFVHLGLAMVFVGGIPYMRTWHIFGSLFNIYTRDLDAPGKVQNIPNMVERMEEGEEVEMGYKRLTDLTWKELLSTDSCTRCGRCQDVCPAYNTGKHLSPKGLINDLRDHFLDEQEKNGKPISPRNFLSDIKGFFNKKQAQAANAENTEEDGPSLLKGEDPDNGVIASDVLWSCTNCMACMNACPVFIEHIPLVTQMRRELAMEFDDTDPQIRSLFKNMDTNVNPWGMNPEDRNQWIGDLKVPTVMENPDFEYLLWVSCLGALDPRSQKITQSFVKILNEAGVNFAILGEMEMCCGDSVRRLGNEASFQVIAKMNLENMAEMEVKPKKVLTCCPHCYNTLKHEYPDFGADWEVMHHTQFILELLSQGKIQTEGGISGTAVYHDSCFLGRYNNIYEEPRKIIEKCGLHVADIEQSRAEGFCCGGGGGRLWLEEEGEKINIKRVGQLKESGAGTFVSACPYCMMMFDEGTKLAGMEEEVKLYDIAELVAEKLLPNK